MEKSFITYSIRRKRLFHRHPINGIAKALVMWMQLPFKIRGNQYSISLVGFLCWIGFALTVFRNNAANWIGLPRWIPVTLAFTLMILTTFATSRLDAQLSIKATDVETLEAESQTTG